MVKTLVCRDCFATLEALPCPWCAAVNAADAVMQAHLAACRKTFKNCEEHHRLYALLTAAEDQRRQH